MHIAKTKKELQKNHGISMSPFTPYVNAIESLAVELISSSANDISNTEIQLVLDGQPMKVLRDVVPIADLKRTGAFFTNHHLSNRLIKSIIPDIKQGQAISDPACGTGNLLLAYARHLPILKNIRTTLDLWGKQLYGSDLHPEFIRAAKTRLILLAIERGAKGALSEINFSNFFPNIQTSNYMSCSSELPGEGCIVINPPYTMVEAPDGCKWASGTVSQAALFIEKCVATAGPGTKIVALLPDVLRTGSRYSKWRNLITSLARIESTEIIGQFDKLTDIDVFFIRMVTTDSSIKEKNSQWWNTSHTLKQSNHIINEYFNVRVGPVVPHRDPDYGQWYPYIHSRLLPFWTTVNIDNDIKKRRYNGTTYKPPFVVVRRTSRPGDSHRAIGTIIVGKQRVAVENHLIILQPKSGEVRDCKILLEKLRSEETSVWLNNRIRCRHLTTSALKEMQF